MSKPSPSLPALVCGRYRIESMLGRGGMGSVYRAFDEGAGQVVALKMLDATSSSLTAAFALEYETLAKLNHPRVIEVYDFGITEAGARYYTMELLEGNDLVNSGTLEWVRACAHLRDVCTSLSLLHAQRLVHRDVNPRNVRLDDAGRAKLLDFGALAPFGVADQLVGTPSCIAPEALRGQPLDARTDLFSLGAVAYWSITGQLPYAIRRLNEAEQAWTAPPAAPSQHVPAIPRALDELVLSLLSVDPLGRPGSAAEVIDRLSAVALLDDELLAGIAESHLCSATLAGRESEQAKTEQLTARTIRGQGGLIMFEGGEGAGRSRLLQELAIDARLTGLITLQVAGKDNTEPDSLLLTLLSELQRALPADVRAGIGKHLGVLASLLERLPLRGVARTLYREEPQREPYERVLRQESAIASLLVELASKRPLLLCVDDAHLLHPSGAGVLLLLTRAAQDARFMVCVTRRDDLPAPPAVEQLRFMGTRLPLAPLDPQAVERLVHSIVGEVPHRTRLAQWLSTSGHGNPGQLLSLLSDLLARDLVRYAGGAWVLPAELGDAATLQASLELGAGRSRLDPLALSLAQLLATKRGPLTEALLSALATESQPADVQAALRRLLEEKLTVFGPEGHRLAHESERKLLLDPLSETAKRALHLSLARGLRDSSRDGFAALRSNRLDGVETGEIVRAISAGLHFLRGGDEARGTQLLRTGSLELTVRGEGLASAAGDLEQAVETYKGLGRDPRVYSGPLTALTLGGTYADWRLSRRYSDEMLALFADSAGIKSARRLTPYLGGKIALFAGLVFGFVAFLLVPRRRVARTFREVLLGLIGVGSAVLGVCTVLQDEVWAKSVGELLSPLRFFPWQHPVRMVHEFQRALLDHVRGKYDDARRRSAVALAYVQSPPAATKLPLTARQQLEAGIYLLLGQIDALRTDAVARDTLAAIDKLDAATAPQTRAGTRVAFHGHRGERGAFLKSLEDMDRLAAHGGSIWRNDVQVPRMLWSTYALCEDVMSLKRAVQQLDSLAQEVPSVARLRAAIDACYLAERGTPRDALMRYEALFQALRDDHSLRAAQYLGAYARILRKAGEPRRAVQICEKTLGRLDRHALGYTMLTFGLRLELPLSKAALGEYASALRLLDALLLEQRQHDNPLVHGLTIGARVELALVLNDHQEAERQLAAMEAWFRNTEHPALFAQFQRLADRARMNRKGETSRPGQIGGKPEEIVSVALSDLFERPERALEQALREAHAERGYLYALEEGSLTLRAGSAPAPDDAVRDELALCLAAQSDHAFETELASESQAGLAAGMMTTITTDASGELLATSVDGKNVYWFPLSRAEKGRSVVVGALLLQEGAVPLKRLSALLLSNVARLHLPAGSNND